MTREQRQTLILKTLSFLLPIGGAIIGGWIWARVSITELDMEVNANQRAIARGVLERDEIRHQSREDMQEIRELLWDLKSEHSE